MIQESIKRFCVTMKTMELVFFGYSYSPSTSQDNPDINLVESLTLEPTASETEEKANIEVQSFRSR